MFEGRDSNGSSPFGSPSASPSASPFDTPRIYPALPTHRGRAGEESENVNEEIEIYSSGVAEVRYGRHSGCE